LALFLLLDLLIGAALWARARCLQAGCSVAARCQVPIGRLLRCFLIVIAANVLTQLFASVTTGCSAWI